jgi:hypothetical protein
LSDAVNRQREKYGLPPMKPPPIDEIQQLIEPAETPEKAAAPADNKGDK